MGTNFSNGAGLSENSDDVKASTFAGFRQENLALPLTQRGKDYTLVRMNYTNNNNICVEPSKIRGKSPNLQIESGAH